MTQDTLERFLDRYDGEDRATKVHACLLDLRARTSDFRLIQAELAAEVEAHGYWQVVTRADGSTYASATDYFEDVFVDVGRTNAYNLLRLGKVIRLTPLAGRSVFRAALAGLGIGKAVVLTPALEKHIGRPRQLEAWLQKARQAASAETLRPAVATALGLTPRGRGRPLDRLLAHLTALGVSPALVEEFFADAAEHCGTTEPKELVTTALQDVMTEWRRR